MSNFKVGDRAVTRDGREVEILKADAPGYYPIIGLLTHENHIDRWPNWDNFVLPKRTRVVTLYLNVYPGSVEPHISKHIAEIGATGDALAVALPHTFTLEW